MLVDLAEVRLRRIAGRDGLDICSISNVTCKNWRENLLLCQLASHAKKNPTVNFGAKSNSPNL